MSGETEEVGREHELIPAAAQNDTAKLRELLAAGCQPSWANHLGQTPLHIAALWIHVESVELLLQSHANVNAVNRLGENTPLHTLFAQDEETSEKQITIARLLIEARADTTLVNKAGCTPADLTEDGRLRQAIGATPFYLHDALRAEDVEALKEALGRISSGELPASLLDSVYQGCTALHLSCGAPNAACAELLLEAKASPIIGTQTTWQTPLHLAARSGSFSIVKMLIEAQADIHAFEPDQDHDWNYASTSFEQDPEKHFNALHIASKAGNIPMMRLLLAATACVNARDSFSRTPLHLCIEQASEDELGLGVGVRVRDLNNQQHSGKFAAIIGPLKIIGDDDDERYPVMVESGPSQGVWLKPSDLRTVFDDAIDLLLESRADVNLGNHKIGMDSSVLHAAARDGNYQLAQKIVAARADVNMQRASNLTPLHMAIRGRRLDVIALLLEARASTDIVSGGKKIEELAAINGIDLNLSGGPPKKRARTTSEVEKIDLFLE